MNKQKIVFRKKKEFLSDITQKSISVKTYFLIEARIDGSPFVPFTSKDGIIHHETAEARNAVLEAAVKEMKDLEHSVKVI